jgi:hypothetical protein
MSVLPFAVRVLAGEIFTSALADQARDQQSVTFAAFPALTLRPTDSVFDDCRAVIVRLYPKAGYAQLSAEKRQAIGIRDLLLRRDYVRFFHPCQSALKGPVYDEFVVSNGLKSGFAIAFVIVDPNIICVMSGVIDRQLPRLLRTYLGPLPFDLGVDSDIPFQSRDLDADAIVRRLWDPYPAPNDAAKPT